MAQENFDLKAAKAVEDYLRLIRENHAMEAKIASNKEQLKLLLSEFPQIGNVKGMLRKEKKSRASATAPTPSDANSSQSTPAPARKVPLSKKRKADKSPTLESTLGRLEQDRDKKKRRPREESVEQGGSDFHATFRSAPPTVQGDDEKTKKKQ